jgi:nucleoside 2-deoxyribosyltransferase
LILEVAEVARHSDTSIEGSKVYLASGLGFSHELKGYRDKTKRRLTEIGCTVSDPWEQPFHAAIEQAHAITDWPARVEAFKRIARQIGTANEDMIRECDAVLGVLDGAEVGSGVASEIGFGAALGMRGRWKNNLPARTKMPPTTQEYRWRLW